MSFALKATRKKKRRKPKPPNPPTWALLRLMVLLALLAWRYHFHFLSDVNYYLIYIGFAFVDYLYVSKNYKTSILADKPNWLLFVLALFSYLVHPVFSVIDLIRAWNYWRGI